MDGMNGWMEEDFAVRILGEAIADGRAAELLETLMEGGAATFDPVENKLRIITGEQVRRLARGPLGDE
jgi:hypothetical protein